MGPVKKDRLADTTMPTSLLGNRLAGVWQWIVDHPRIAILLMVIFSLALAVFMKNLRIDPSLESLVVRGSTAKLTYNEFIAQYGSDEFVVLAAKAPDGDVFTTHNLSLIKQVASELSKIPYAQDVQSLATTPIIRGEGDDIIIGSLYDDPPTNPTLLASLKNEAVKNPLLSGTLVSEAGDVCVWIVFPDLRENDNTQMRIDLYNGVKEIADQYLTGFEVHLDGIPVVKTTMVKAILRSIILFGTVSALLITIVLFFTFGSLRGVIVPGTVIFLSMVWTLGVMGATGGVLDTVSSLIFALIVVVSVGDTVHILVQYYEEYFRLGDIRRALIETLKKIFTPCLLTSTTTAIGFASLIAIPVPPVQHFGMYAAVGVFSAFLISIIIAPAILVLMSAPAPKFQKRFVGGKLSNGLERLGGFNVRRRRLILMASVVLVSISIFGISKIQVETQVSKFFHTWSPIVKGFRFLDEHLTPPLPMEIFFEAEPDRFLEPETWQWVEALTNEALEIPRVIRIHSYHDALKEMEWAIRNGEQIRDPDTWKLPETRQAIAQYSLLYSMDSAQSMERYVSPDFSKAHISFRIKDSASAELLEIIDQLEQIAKKHVPDDVRWEITGGTVVFVKVVEALVKGQVRSLAVALGIITLIIAMLFRSLKIGLLSMIPNVLPILFMLGVMGIFGFQLDTTTVMIGPITLGIAVDDTIHFITRFRREYGACHDSEKAMRLTLLSTGRALVSTTFIISIGFFVTMFSSFRPQSILGGLGVLTIAMALAADLMLLPAVMMTMRKRRKTGEPCDSPD